MGSEIFDLGSELIRLFAWFALAILPGVLVTFALPLRRLGYWAKFLVGVSLSPLILGVQFYAVRLAGVSFESTLNLLLLANLLALVLLYIKRTEFHLPPIRTVLIGALVFAVPCALLVPQIMDANVRIFTGHSWMQSDVVYLLSNGNLTFEEPELAGLRLCYPAAAHPFQALLSVALDSPPASSYLWTNLLWLLLIFLLVALTLDAVGGQIFAKLGAVILLCFGLNVVGYVFFIMMPGVVSGEFWDHGPYNYLWFGGDYRITPWLLKYYFFEQSILGQALVAAIILVLLLVNGAPQVDELVVLGLLLIGVGLIYPAHFSVAVFAVLAAAAAGVYTKTTDRKSLIGLAIVLIAASIVTFAYLKFLTTDRVTASLFFPSLTSRFLWYALVKSVACLVCVIPFLALIGIDIRKYVTEQTYASAMLLGTGLACMAMYVLIEIPSPAAEYKFLLLAAIFLTPLAALSLEKLIWRDRRRAFPLTIAAFLALVLPSVHKIYTDFPWSPRWRVPVVDGSKFDLRLAVNEPLSGVVWVIRNDTPIDSILVIERSDIHLPTLTQRTLYAPPLQERPHPGVFISSEFLLGRQKGYGREIVERRRATVNDLFNASDAANIDRALEEISRHKRPIAIVLYPAQNQLLRERLATGARASRMFSDDARELWLAGDIR